MGEIGMIKGGFGFLEALLRRVIVDVVDHSGIDSDLGVYRREEGEETINIMQTKHNMAKHGARGYLT